MRRMFSAVKLIAYLLGALALLFVVAPPNTQPEPVLIEMPPVETAPVLAASSTTVPMDLTTTNTEKTEAEPKPLPKIVMPEPKPLAIPPTAIPVAVQPVPPLFPSTETVPTTTPIVMKEKPAVSFTELNQKTRAALVNVLCTTLRSGSFEPLSGSGVIVDSRGVVLTNAQTHGLSLLSVGGYRWGLPKKNIPQKNKFTKRRVSNTLT